MNTRTNNAIETIKQIHPATQDRTMQDSADEKRKFAEKVDTHEPIATDFGPYSLSRRQ